MPLVQPGEPIPDATLPDQRGRAASLRGLLNGPLILYFYPEDDTPSCTKEACQFRDLSSELSALGAAVVGISPDTHEKHAKFDAKHALGFTLLADQPVNGVPPVCNQFGVWGQKSMYGRTYMGVIRTTYLIRTDGTVARRWDSVRVPGHAADVLAALRELNGFSSSPSPRPSSPSTGKSKGKPKPKSPALKKPAAKKPPRRGKSARSSGR